MHHVKPPVCSISYCSVSLFSIAFRAGVRLPVIGLWVAGWVMGACLLSARPTCAQDVLPRRAPEQNKMVPNKREQNKREQNKREQSGVAPREAVQGGELPHREEGKASASNPGIGKQNRPHSARQVAKKPVSQQELADAVLADTLSRLFEQADTHFDHGEYNHTINLCRIVVQGDPHNVEAYADSAFLLWSTDRSAEGIALLKEGIQANPNGYFLYDELGAHYLLHLNDAKSALPYYEQATQFKCPFFTWNGLAHCYEKTDQWEKAVKAWETAVRFVDNPSAPRQLARARAELAKQQGDKR